MNLYQMNEEITRLLDSLVDEETGEVNEEALAQLDQLEADKDEKIKNCGLYIKNRAAFADALTAEIKALTARRQAIMNKIERTMNYVGNALEGQPREYPEVTFGWRKSQAVEVVNEEIIPDELCIYKTERRPSKTEIKKLLKNGEQVPGCVLVDKQNLQVK